MKLCDVTQFWSPASGGVRRYITEKKKHWRAAGGRHVLIIPGAEDSVTGDDVARIYTVKSPLVSRQTGYRVLLRLSEIDRILEGERPDLVENSDPYQLGWRVARECKRLRIPSISFYHSHFAESELRPLNRWLAAPAVDLLIDLAARFCRSLYNQYSTTFVPSPDIAQVLEQWGLENAVVTDLGVDTDAFRPGTSPKAEVRRKLGIPEGAMLLLYVGRLGMEKNTRTLSKAIELLARRRPGKFHWIIAGEGKQRPYVAHAEKATGAVTWLPHLSEHERLLELYHAADVFVHPGVQETFGLVTVEAQACALPVVGIRGSAMDRVVGHDQSFWAEKNSATSLANAMERAFDLDLKALGQTAFQATVERFSWKNVFARQFDVYRKVVQQYGTA